MTAPTIPKPMTSTDESRRRSEWIRWGLSSTIVAILGGGFGVGIDSWSTSRLLKQARALSASDQKRSEAAYRQYLRRFPGDGSVRLELVEEIRRHDPDAALRELRRIEPDSPAFADAVRLAATLSLELGRDYDALAPLQLLARQFPEDAGVQLALAELRYRERDFDAALTHARRCREINPRLTGAYLVEAESLDDLKRSTEMVEPLEAVLQLDPELPQVHLNLAYAYPLVGREEEALMHVDWFLQRFPKSPAGYRTLALVHRARGRTEEALVAVQKSLDLKPHQLEATLLEAELLLFLRRSDEAYEKLQRLYNLHGAEHRLLTLLQRAAQLSGRKSEAAKWQQRLSRLNPNGRSR